MSKKILVITVNELKNDNRVINEANALVSFGHDVDLVCLRNRNSDQQGHSYKFNAFELKLFFEKWQKFYPVKFFKFFELIFRLLLISRKKSYEVIHAHDLDGLFVSKFVKRLSKPAVKIVYDAHEYETEVNGLTGIKKQFYKITERIFIKKIDAFITVSDSIASEYERLYGIKNATIILNTPNFSGYKNNRAYDHFRNKMNIRSDQRVFLYQGYLKRGRGIELLIKAFQNMPDDKNVIVFLGNGLLTEFVTDQSENSDVIFHHDFVSGDKIYEYTSSADIGISFIEDISLSYRYCMPNKLFEYMSAGLPVITSNLPDMKKFVQTYEIGLVATDNTVDGFANVIGRFNEKNISMYKENALATSKIVNWEAQEKKLNKLYSSI